MWLGRGAVAFGRDGVALRRYQGQKPGEGGRGLGVCGVSSGALVVGSRGAHAQPYWWRSASGLVHRRPWPGQGLAEALGAFSGRALRSGYGGGGGGMGPRPPPVLVMLVFCQTVQMFMSYDGGATPACLDEISRSAGSWSQAELGLLGSLDKFGMTLSSVLWGRVLQALRLAFRECSPRSKFASLPIRPRLVVTSREIASSALRRPPRRGAALTYLVPNY